jgi:hypothetical protein
MNGIDDDDGCRFVCLLVAIGTVCLVSALETQFFVAIDSPQLGDTIVIFNICFQLMFRSFFVCVSQMLSFLRSSDSPQSR